MGAWHPGRFQSPDALSGCGERGWGRPCVAHPLPVQGDADLQGLTPGPKGDPSPTSSDSISIFFHTTSGICFRASQQSALPFEVLPSPDTDLSQDRSTAWPSKLLSVCASHSQSTALFPSLSPSPPCPSQPLSSAPLYNTTIDLATLP